MSPVGVDESVSDESPDIRAAARQRAAKYKRIVVARRNESEIEQKFDVLLFAQYERAHDVNERQHSQYEDDNRRNVEERFAFHEEDPVRTVSYAASQPRRKPLRRAD